VAAARIAGTALAAAALAAPLAAQAGPSATLVADPSRPSIGLEEAILRAQAVLPLVAQANAQLTNASAQKRSAVGAYLPNLNATSNFGRLYSENARPDPITGAPVTAGSSVNSLAFGGNASLVLFDGFQRSATSKAAGATYASAEAGLIDARYQARLQVTQQFVAALAAAQLVSVREAALKRAEEQLRQAVARLRAGSATRSDSLRARVQVGTAQQDLITALATLRGQEATLGQLVGDERPVAAREDSSVYRRTAALDRAALVAEALAQSPQVTSADRAAAAARASLTAAKRVYFPTISLNGNVTWNGNNQVDYQLFNQRQLSLVLNWPLFNRFVREQSITAQSAAASVAEAQAADARRQVAAAVESQLATLEAASERVRLTQLNVTAAEEDLRVQNERYRLGAATALDVLTSQEALTQAEVNVVSARFDYARAKAQLEALLGRTL